MVSLLNVRSYFVWSLLLPNLIFAMESEWERAGKEILSIDKNAVDYPYAYFNVSSEEIFNKNDEKNALKEFKTLDRKLKQLIKEYHPDKIEDLNSKDFAQNVIKKLYEMRDTIKNDIERGYVARENTKQKENTSNDTFYQNLFRDAMKDNFWEKQEKEAEQLFSNFIENQAQSSFLGKVLKSYTTLENKEQLESVDDIKNFLDCTKNMDVLLLSEENQKNKEVIAVNKKLKSLDPKGAIVNSFLSLKRSIERYIDVQKTNRLELRKELDKSLHTFYESIKSIIKYEGKKNLIDLLILGYRDINNYSDDFKEVLNTKRILFTNFLQSVDELKKKQKIELDELEKAKERYIDRLESQNNFAQFNRFARNNLDEENRKIKEKIETIEEKIKKIAIPITEPKITFGSEKYNLLEVIKTSDAQLRKSIINPWKKWAYRFGLGTALAGGAYLINKYFNTPRQPIKN